MTDIDVIAIGAAVAKSKKYTDNTIATLPKGVVYKGAVNYYNNLPANATIGDCYTVKYTGTSGTTVDGSEYAWGKYEGTNQWIKLGKDYDAAVNELKESLDNKEATANKVTSLSSASTDTQYPTAKCVYDLVGNIESALEALL